MTGDLIRFTIVLSCFLLSWTYKEYASSKRDAYSLRFALFLTVWGDVCLILINAPVPGLLLFCAVQLIYVYRYGGMEILLPTALTAPIIFLMSKTIFPDIIPIALAYAFCLTAGSVASFFSNLPGLNGRLTRLAMVLFMLCDIFVAIYNLNGIRNTAFYLIWVFYFPSQLLLAFSAKAHLTGASDS